ncbi:MAG: methionyl-tRNA formyltransferase [Lachnospiraceae bacterium]|nr:methionyl-tRNA formyltransferase [Lachnospiraceae bacterium]
MNVVFMGTPDFASGILKALHEAGYTISGVVTQPDKPVGRKKEPVAGPVKQEALAIGCPIFQPVKVRTPESVEEVAAMKPDLIVVAAFGQIIPKSILDMPKYGCINVHASLLPDYRGASPIQRAILDGRKETGVTIMRMNEGLDTGDIISKVVIPIDQEETGGSLFDKLAEAGAKLLLDTIPTIVDGTATYEPQPEKSPTPYAAMLTKAMGRIDWTQSAEEIERQVRAMNPWPSAYSTLDGKGFKIWKAHVEKPDMEGEPGSILRQDRKGLYVQTGHGVLCIDEVQMESRKRMTTADFFRGYVIRSDRFEES